MIKASERCNKVLTHTSSFAKESISVSDCLKTCESLLYFHFKGFVGGSAWRQRMHRLQIDCDRASRRLVQWRRCIKPRSLRRRRGLGRSSADDSRRMHRLWRGQVRTNFWRSVVATNAPERLPGQCLADEVQRRHRSLACEGLHGVDLRSNCHRWPPAARRVRNNDWAGERIEESSE